MTAPLYSFGIGRQLLVFLLLAVAIVGLYEGKPKTEETLPDLVKRLAETPINPSDGKAGDIVARLLPHKFDAAIEINNLAKQIDSSKSAKRSQYSQLESLTYGFMELIDESHEVLELQYSSSSPSRRFIAVRTASVLRRPFWDLVKKARSDQSSLVRDLAIDLLRRGKIDD